jgi:UDP-N-acetyl-D-galactosamine dehydrogenase
MTGANPRADANAPPRQQPTARLCVVGVGTVGLQQLLAFDAAGHDTVGYDFDADLIDAYRRGADPTGTAGGDRIDDCACSFTADPSAIEAAAYVFVAVPTATDSGDPTLDCVRAAGRTVGQHLDPETTVVLVSTVAPGTTERVFVPVLEASSGLTAGEEFAVAHAPERLSPSTDGQTVFPETRLVGAASKEVAEDVATRLEASAGSVRVVDSLRVAEAAKCVENVQRDVNIALVNELTRVLGAMGLDPRSVLDAAGTKWNFHRYEPGLVGGECVPVAPRLLAASAERAGSTLRLVDLARSVNERMIDRVVETTITALARRAARLRDRGADRAPGRPDVVVLGLSYKPDSGSLAASPSREVVDRLRERGLCVAGHDPLVAADRAAEELDIEVVTAAEITGFDAAIVLVGHARFESLCLPDLRERLGPSPVVVDVPGVFDPPADADDLQYKGLCDVS